MVIAPPYQFGEHIFNRHPHQLGVCKTRYYIIIAKDFIIDQLREVWKFRAMTKGRTYNKIDKLFLGTISGDKKEEMVMKNIRIKMIWAAMFCLLFIIGCGGGGGGGGSQTVIAEPNMSLSETSVMISVVIVVKNSAERQFTITSTGDRDLRITSFSSSDANFPGDPQFNVVSDDCSGKSVAPNASCTFIARFTPAAHGAQSGTISING